MHNFTYSCPTKIVFGKDVINSLADELKALGSRKVLLVYGKSSIKRSGLYDTVIEQLKVGGIDVIEHSGVKGNPIVSHVREGIKLAKAEGVDTILAVGGGSVIDEGKAISAGMKVDFDVWDFYAGKESIKEITPLVAVLTLPATGTEMNGISVITNEETSEKVSMKYNGVLNPKVSFMDPTLTFTLSAKQTAYACADIISHMTEGYFTTTDKYSIVQDNLLEGNIRSVMQAMDIIKNDPDNYDARAAFMWSSTLAWSSLLHSGLGGWGFPCHALAMPLSAVYDVIHGAALSVVIPGWIQNAGHMHIHRLSLFTDRIFGKKTNSPEEIADIMRVYYTSIGAPITIKEAGVDSADLKLMTDLAADSFIKRNVSGYDTELIRNIFETING